MDPESKAAREETGRALQRQTQVLRKDLVVFNRHARKLVDWLDPSLSEEEVEAMETPAANLLGTLECLLADDFDPACRKLNELDALLKDGSVAGHLREGSSPDAAA
jgi:hypothetical protein